MTGEKEGAAPNRVGREGGGWIILQGRAADAGCVDAWMLTAPAFRAMCCNCMQMDLKSGS